MEVGDKAVDAVELDTGIEEDVGVAAAGFDLAILGGNGFQGAAAGGSNRNDAVPGGLGLPDALGGFLAGMGQMTGRRMVPCVLFALGTGGMLAYTGTIAWGALGAAAAAPLIMGVLPREADEFLRQQTRRFHPLPDAPGDAYAAYALRRWEKTVGDMARAVPSPVGLGEKRTPQWWEEHLCASCPERAVCGCMNTELGQSRAEYIWKAHEASDEVWAQRLESLRGLGCARLYQLMDSMNLLRAENADEQRIIRRACQQRDMLVTHLTALSGSARHLAALSSVDVQLYEAAKIDGAGRWQLMWHVTLPAIRGTIVLMLIMKVGQLLNTSYEQIFLMQNSMNRAASDVFDTYVYTKGITGGQYSLATATGLFKSTISMLMVVTANKIAKLCGESGLY